MTTIEIPDWALALLLAILVIQVVLHFVDAMLAVVKFITAQRIERRTRRMVRKHMDELVQDLRARHERQKERTV